MCLINIFMSVYHWILLTGLLIFIISFIYIFINVLFTRKYIEYSKKSGEVSQGIFYSFTSGMSPVKKESAYLHLPTYLAGMVFHIGTFTGFFWLGLCFLNNCCNLLPP